MTDELHWLPLSDPLPGVAVWQAYNPKSRVDFTSSAVAVGKDLYLFDPIPLEEEPLQELLSYGSPAAIYLTSGNHERASAEYARRFKIPIHAHSQAIGEFTTEEAKAAHSFEDGALLPGGFRAIFLPGGSEGETAFYHESNGGCLVLGDALVNLGSTNFSVLPDKYCLNAAELHKSLRSLEKLPLEKLFFAHGLPIVQKARERLATLLATE